MVKYIRHVDSSLYCKAIIQSGLIGESKIRERRTKHRTIHSSGSFEGTTTRRTVRRERPKSGNWKVYHTAVYWINLKSAQDRGLKFWRTNSNAVILDDFVPADCHGKVVNHKTADILYQKIRLSPRPPPKVALKSAWQVRHESTGKPVADQVTIRPEVGSRLPGVPPEEP